MNHKTLEEVEMEFYGMNVLDRKCPYCGGILVEKSQSGITLTFCVEIESCDYEEYDYD